MTEPTQKFTFEIRGADAGTVAEAFGSAVKEAIDAEPDTRHSAKPDNEDRQKSIDVPTALGIATVFLTFPPAAIATWDFVDRVKSILEKRKALKAAYPETEISAVAPDGSTLDLEPGAAAKMVGTAIESQAETESESRS